MAVTDNNKELVNFIYDLREAADSVGASGLILSYRAAQNVARMEQVELPLTDCIKQCIAWNFCWSLALCTQAARQSLRSN